MTNHVPGEAADPRDELMSAFRDVVSAEFVDGVLDGSVPIDALEHNATDHDGHRIELQVGGEIRR